MSTFYPGGRHELGQNFLVNRKIINEFISLVNDSHGPIIEIGAGSGALTMPLGQLGRPVTAVEIDPVRADKLRARVGPAVNVATGDIHTFQFPRSPHTVVGNIPFHLTTAILRRILEEPGWHGALLIVQWEVARRRAGVGGATLLTASWWPWYQFTLVRRIPAHSFRPVPSVDGGLLSIARRDHAFVPDRDLLTYQRFVKDVFTGRGRGVLGILRASGKLSSADIDVWARRNRVGPAALPKDLKAEQWASLWHAIPTQRDAHSRYKPAPGKRRRSRAPDRKMGR
ncbi:MAG: 23S ribosomal RNA methyltransferase Erm [Leucobacter sp.]